jgi:hypothetical protein
MLCALNAHVQKCKRVIKSSLKLSDLNITELMENYKFGKVVTG